MTDFTPNTFITNLARICGEHLLAEKWLLAPNRRVGNQWVEQVARSGQPAVNLRVATLTGLALRVAAAHMPPGARVVSDLGSRVIIDDMLTNVVNAGRDGYLTGLLDGGARKSPGLVRLLAGTIEDMRMSGAGVSDLKDSWLEVPAKKKELLKLYVLYLDALKKHSLMDRADTFTLAMDALVSGTEVVGPRDLILVPDIPLDHLLEEQFIDSLHEEAVVNIPLDEPDAETVGGNISLLGHIRLPTSAPEAEKIVNDDTAIIVSCVGEINEVRSALRILLERASPFDHLEILVTDNTTYIPMIYEEALRISIDLESPTGEAPVTFADGIPTRYSRPGRALAGWIQWVREDYTQSHLVRMLQDGLLEPGGSGESNIGNRELSRMLSSLPIGYGRDRYLEVISKAQQATDRRLERQETACAEGEGKDSDLERTRRRSKVLAVLHKLVEEILNITPASTDNTDPDWLKAALNILSRLIRDVNRLDNFAREAFEKDIGEFLQWADLGLNLHNLDLVEWLASLPLTLRVGGTGPAKGCIHVSSVATGGHSGRPLTVVLGLDDSRFPGGRHQDPVLLDRERERFKTPLATSASRLTARVDFFASLLARLRGQVVFTYSCRNLSDDREMFPSPVLLSAFRILYGNRQADLDEMSRTLSPPRSFAPTALEDCLTEDDWWMLRCCGNPHMEQAREHLFRRYGHLQTGQEGEDRRAGGGLTDMTGHVPEAAPDINPATPGARPLSPSRMEKMGECPMRYFFAEILGIEPPEEIAGKDQEEWLNALQFGSLLHEVLAEFTRKLLETGEQPGFDMHLPVMEKIVSERLAAWRRESPPPSEDLYHVQERRLVRASRNFLRDEEAESSTLTPVAVELPIGLGGRAIDTVHPDPVPVSLSDGTSFNIRGRIDRVDLISGGENDGYCLLTDYKSGQAKSYQPPEGDATSGGRRLQPLLYLAMARAWAAGTKNEVVSGFRYTFPASWYSDEPVFFDSTELDRNFPALGHIVSLMAAGVFPATDDYEKDCRYCPYKGSICVDVKTQANKMAEALADGGDIDLDPFRALRGYTRHE